MKPRMSTNLPVVCIQPKFIATNIDIEFILFYCILILSIMFCLQCFAFSALTLLVGRQEDCLACKNRVMRCWCGYLSGARCRLFAYGPADAIVVVDRRLRRCSRSWIRSRRYEGIEVLWILNVSTATLYSILCWTGSQCNILSNGLAWDRLPSFKSRLVLPFWYRLTQVVLEKEAVKRL